MSTVLIVDDVQTERELIGKVVTMAGHTPIYATNGTDALATAKQANPALIFMDVVMPNADGFKTCREIRSAPETKNIPIVLVTSKNAESDKFWGQKQGANGHVGKPFSPNDIAAMIQRFVR